MSPEFWLQLIIAIGSGCAVYAGIKSDLTRSILLAEEAMRHAAEVRGEVAAAHSRISAHVENFHVK